ncbi:MAG: LLM class flavin-dependent oxidoreductase [Sulfurimonadaceae bacterium]|jgi:alkanesulfonate monooxygenase SsuD/methylene tetrahydromethanopterin reductase-like flavin-dependent oxidoreductase (luciferase family)|nr:LLM class flavin-dependent oxidoreductase [Sulfurimonadaceae bacterium]
MKLGIFLLTESYDASTQATIAGDIEVGIYADALGFDSVWFAEHHFNAFSCIPNPTLMMAALAVQTQDITISSAAFLAPFYQPIRLAEEIATLDNLSNGRVAAGFAKGGFAYDIEHFEKSPENLRKELYENVLKIEDILKNNSDLQPKPIQKSIPFYIATFSTRETIEFAASRGYGLMFSQGATIEECKNAQEIYKELAGFYPETVLMRVFHYHEDGYDMSYELASPATDYFIKCMRAMQSKQTQPTFSKENYDALLSQRYQFFDGKKFLDSAILGNKEECIGQIKDIEKEIHNLHLVLKVASTNVSQTKSMLKTFSTDIKPHII